MKKTLIVLGFIIIGIIFTVSNADANIEVNGYLGDWGVTPGACGASDWAPDSGIVYYEEDQNSWKLGPGYGGQQFDAEAIYATRENGYMCLAIVTGHPATGYNVGGIDYYPGDIFINFGPGRQYGIKTTGANAGHLYKNPLWNKAMYDWDGETDPTTMQDGNWEDRGLTDFCYLHTYFGEGDCNDHWVMEMKAPYSYFEDNWKDGGAIHWTQTCGNDGIDLEFPAHTPEPATMSLLGLGLAGLLKIRRKRI